MQRQRPNGCWSLPNMDARYVGMTTEDTTEMQ
jgi:hypothetical protein